MNSDRSFILIDACFINSRNSFMKIGVSFTNSDTSFINFGRSFINVGTCFIKMEKSCPFCVRQLFYYLFSFVLIFSAGKLNSADLSVLWRSCSKYGFYILLNFQCNFYQSRIFCVKNTISRNSCVAVNDFCIDDVGICGLQICVKCCE